MAAVKHDEYLLAKYTFDIPPIPEKEMGLLKRYHLHGTQLAEIETTVQNDPNTTNTTLSDTFGPLDMTFYIEQISQSWVDLVNKQISGDWPGSEKPTGSITSTNHAGDDQISIELQRYHIQSFSVGPFDRKNKTTPMEMNATLCLEKWELK